MDVYGHTFEMSMHSILQRILDSRFVCINLKLSGTSLVPPQATPVSDSQNPALQQRYEEIKAAVEHYQILQFGLTCVKEDLDQKRYELSTYNFNLQPIPDRTLHISRLIHIDSNAFEVSSLSNFKIEVCFAKGIPYCSREEEDNSRTIEYGEAQHCERDSIVLQRDPLIGLRKVLLHGLDEFFYITNSFDGVKRLRARRPGRVRPACYVPVDSEFERYLVHEIVKEQYPELCVKKDASRDHGKAVQVHIKEAWIKQMGKTPFEERLRCQTGFRFIAEALCPKIDKFVDTRVWSPLGYDLKDCQKSLLTPELLDTLKPPPPPRKPYKKDEGPPPAPGCLNTLHQDREATLWVQYTTLILALQQKKIMLVGDNLFVDLVYFFNTFFGRLPRTLQRFVAITRAMFPLIVDEAFLVQNLGCTSSEQTVTRKQRQTPTGPKIHEHYPVKTAASDAGCESYLTTVAFLNLASRADDPNRFIPPVGSQFWDEFGNRIIARGTQEAILRVRLG